LRSFCFRTFCFLAPEAVAIEAKRRLDFLSLDANRRATRITAGRLFAVKRPKIVQILRIFPILLTV
jgi:hypothetical protein